jgi:hypothetical protein
MAAAVLGPLVQGGVVQPPWRVAGVPQQVKPLTQFTVETVQGREALRVQAAGSYGNLVHDWPLAAAMPTRLQWSWRLQQANAEIDLRQKAGDDAPVKVCLGFKMPLDRVPFMERQLLRLARSQVKEDLPAATLCWVWAHGEEKGALIDNAYSRRVRYLVLRNRQDALGTWVEESRDIAADFRRAFGEESADLPPLGAVIVGGDADNTGSSSVAHVIGLRALP